MEPWAVLVIPGVLAMLLFLPSLATNARERARSKAGMAEPEAFGPEYDVGVAESLP